MVIAGLLAALSVVEPPLKGRPDNYIGAIGPFEMVAVVRPHRFRLDETATLVVTIEGAGDLSNVRPPDLSKSRSFADRFDLVAPPKRAIEQHKVRFEYPVRARSAAVKAVPKLEAYIFDDAPPRPHYRLLRTAEIQVEILPPSESRVLAAPPTLKTHADDSFWTRFAYGVGGGVILLAIGLFLRVVRRRREAPARMDAAPNTERSKGRPRKPEAPPAEVPRDRAAQWFDRLGEALALPPGRRTVAEIAVAAAQLGVDPPMIDLLRKNLMTLDAQRFGRGQEAANDADLAAALDDIFERKRRAIESSTGEAALPQETNHPASGDP